jgi:hypothetical protein
MRQKKISGGRSHFASVIIRSLFYLNVNSHFCEVSTYHLHFPEEKTESHRNQSLAYILRTTEGQVGF